VPLVEANNKSLVPLTAVSGAVGLVKFEVYNADPFTHLKFVICPLYAATVLVVVSLPIRSVFVASAKFVEFDNVVPI
jgi:hypothetical protein